MKLGNVMAILLMAALALASAAQASKIEVDTQYDFKLALDYVFTARVDTILLVTSGGIYTTADTMHLQIKKPVVIMAKPGLAEKPVFRHGDLDSSVIEIFRIHDDVIFQGIIFDGYNAKRPMKYGLRVGHGPATQIPRIFAREGLNITIRDCEFRDFFPPNWENDAGGNAFYFLAPASGEPVIKAGNVKIENCTFRNIGDEAIRIAETEKYKVTRALDSLIVRNCTFKNVFAECVRFYADTDTSSADAYVLIEHLTVDSCGTRMAYFKNNKNVIFRDILVTNSHLPKPYRAERADYVVQVQLPGSTISHIDTLNLIFAVPYSSRISASKGGKVNGATIYAFDPLYRNTLAGDYTLLADSPAYGSAHDGQALGDLRWATQTATRVPFLLTIEGMGTVLCDPPLIAPNYPTGTTVTLTAVPDSAWQFAGWSGAITGAANPATVTVNGSTSIAVKFEQSTGVAAAPLQPAVYALAQNYPNPFNASTTLNFSLEREGMTSLVLYNMLGQKLRTLLEKKLTAGAHTLNFDAADLPSGIYLYQLRSGSFQATRKFILMK
ncbi:MAG TPA: T9SS type A sorting domain-containing protein [bacterium]|nr:T9SS type A sorting domain-containing protein [bacterium]HPG82832.1 T9SS type A sorting domain-containing protein [bacterium]HPM59626.1 T9SS type A sorting domain-containing protein [bacterium]